MRFSSSRPIIFHRFFSRDWKHGLFVLENELGYSYCQATSPIYLTRMLLNGFEEESTPKEAFTRFLLQAISQVTGGFENSVVSIPRLGEWHCDFRAGDKRWQVKWENNGKEMFVDVASKSIKSSIKRTHKNWRLNENGFIETEEKWAYVDQFREGCPEEEELENYFIREDVSAVRQALELWLLRQEVIKVPVEEQVSLAKWLKGLQSGLSGKVSVTFDFVDGLGPSKFTKSIALSGNRYKAEDGTRVSFNNEEAKQFAASVHGQIKPYTADDYLQEATAWLGLQDKEELMRLKPKWTLLEKYEKLSPSQRAAVYSLPSKAWEEIESDFWVSEWERKTFFVKQLQEEGEYISPNVNENLLNMICDYWKSKLTIDITTSEKFGISKRDNRYKRVPFWEGVNYPMGVDFSSPCIFALVWTEILWCVMQDIEVQRCEFCQELFVSKKSSRFCSKKCNEDYLSTEETVRSTLKGLHQDLSRMIKKLEVGEASMEEYMELWRNWESLKLQAKGKARQAKKIHPGLVFLHTAEGKQVAQAMKQALREKDEYAEGDAWNDYVGLLKKYGIPQPPREWVKAFLKTP